MEKNERGVHTIRRCPESAKKRIRPLSGRVMLSLFSIMIFKGESLS